MSENNYIVEKISKKFNDLTSIKISELNIAVASPSRKAIEHRFYKMTCNQDHKTRTFFIKNILNETEELVNFNEISKNYRDINTNNTAKLFSVMPEDKLIILEYLKNYKTTNLKQLRDKKNITKILNFKKDFNKLPNLTNSNSVFSLIDHYLNYIKNNNIPNFNNDKFYINSYNFIKKKFKNIDKDNLPCHIDNSASNFMISENNDLKIIDLDFCSNDDPLSDLGSFASEVCLFKNEINPIIEEYFGVFKQNLANRCFIYSTLDDLKWGLYSFIFSKISERNHIEFMKYANWRFLSCNQKLLNYDLGEIIENI